MSKDTSPETYVKDGSADRVVTTEAERTKAVAAGFTLKPSAFDQLADRERAKDPNRTPHTETKGDAQSRHEAEAAQVGHHHVPAVNSHRLASYKLAAPETEHKLTGAHLFSYAQTILALVKADTTKERQAIADAALDGIDQLVYTAANTPAGIAAQKEADKKKADAEAKDAKDQATAEKARADAEAKIAK